MQQPAALRRLLVVGRHSVGRSGLRVTRGMASASAGAGADEPPVLFTSHGGARVVCLNRPKALNALNLDMVRLIDAQLDEWHADDGARVVVTKGAGGKALCAGGDVVAIARAGQAGGSLPAEFFREEYQLDYRLAHMRLPHVALMDGITMGGGVGLSVHSAVRVATEKTMFAMPETAIGFFPDVGGGHFLPRLDGHMGMFLALSGHRLKAGDVLYSGIATHFVRSERIPELEAALGDVEEASDDAVADVVSAFAEEPEGGAEILKLRPAIDRCFGRDSVPQILAALDAEADSGSPDAEWAAKTVKTIRRMSPMSCAVTLQQLRTGAGLDLAGVLKMEYRVSQAFMGAKDFYEGIRAVLIDKDNAPEWRDKQMAEGAVAAYFAKLGDNELVLPASEVPPNLDLGLLSERVIKEAIAATVGGEAEGSVSAEEALARVVAAVGEAVMARPGNKTKVAQVIMNLSA